MFLNGLKIFGVPLARFKLIILVFKIDVLDVLHDNYVFIIYITFKLFR